MQAGNMKIFTQA